MVMNVPAICIVIMVVAKVSMVTQPKHIVMSAIQMTAVGIGRITEAEMESACCEIGT